MDRKEFLALIGMSAGAFAVINCIESCGKAPAPGYPAPPTNVNFSLNLWESGNSALSVDGGYLYTGGIIIARINSADYIAVSQYCTHQGTSVVYRGSGQSNFYCSNHGSEFYTNGAVLNGPATVALMLYKTSLTPTINGNILTVKS